MYGLHGFLQHWTELDTTGCSRPPARHQHAACCIAGPLTGQELLVGGGLGEVLSVLKDMWLLDVHRGMWSEVSGLYAWCMMSCIKSAYVLLLTYMCMGICLESLV